MVAAVMIAILYFNFNNNNNKNHVDKDVLEQQKLGIALDHIVSLCDEVLVIICTPTTFLTQQHETVKYAVYKVVKVR